MLKIPNICQRLGSGVENAYTVRRTMELFNDDYTVKINGVPCQVRACRVSAVPFNRGWPGQQRPIGQSELASYITFSGDEAVRLEVTCKRSFRRVTVRPLSKQMACQVIGQKVEFQLEKCGQYVLELDDHHYALHIFYNPVLMPEVIARANIVFGPGIHFPGTIELKDNDIVYLDDSAIVYGELHGHRVKNVQILGNGVIDGGTRERVLDFWYDDFLGGNIKFYHSSNIVIHGVILLNASMWVMSFFDCSHIEIDNVKITGQWRYNTDGIDIVNSSCVTIRNSFVRAFDDALVFKGVGEYASHDVEDIVVENCVVWCDWGRSLEIGIETCAACYNNLRFSHCDLIHNSASAIDIQNGDYADIGNIVFENIHVEYQTATRLEEFQESDDHTYSCGEQIGVPELIVVTNSRYWITRTAEMGFTHDVTYRNIFVYVEEGVPPPSIRIISCDEDVKCSGMLIENLYFNGEKVSDYSKFHFQTNENVDVIRLLSLPDGTPGV